MKCSVIRKVCRVLHGINISNLVKVLLFLSIFLENLLKEIYIIVKVFFLENSQLVSSNTRLVCYHCGAGRPGSTVGSTSI